MNHDAHIKTIKGIVINDLSYYKELLQAWEQVTYNTKKDGTPYKDLSKSFTGARYFQSYSNFQLEVTTKNQYGRYGKDIIFCSQFTDNGIKVYSLDKIQELIKARKQQLKDTITNYEVLLPRLDTVLDSYMTKMDILMDEFISDTPLDNLSLWGQFKRTYINNMYE